MSCVSPSNSGSSCVPTAGGCARCEQVPAGPIPADLSALLLGPRDKDAAATLTHFLKETDAHYQTLGPLLVVRAARPVLLALVAEMRSGLSVYTQACISAAYSSTDVMTAEQALSAMIYSVPLNQLLGQIEHEWVRSALRDNWFFSVFHPIIDPRSGSVFANEALLRARDPNTAKVLGPAQLIEACEKLNLLHQLDQRARTAHIQAASVHLKSQSRIFINFLPNTIYDPEICLRTTIAAANQHHVPIDRLVFEVIETEKIHDMDHLHRVLDYYRQRGVGTAIDDMGAGYTSMNYITSLQPDFVKLDREFMLDAAVNPQTRQAMDSIVSTAHSINARVIAEGIETPEQMTMCMDAGVDLLQGFLFAKPACPPQEVRIPTPTRKAA